MKALLSTAKDQNVVSQVAVINQPTPKSGEVLIRAEYSSLNYKDALAVTGQGKIFKSLPLIGGIDVAGTVEESRSPDFKTGDFVLVTGCGLGETHNGGYSGWVCERSENVIRRSPRLSAREAMIYGTAGFTAALALERMLQMGQTIEMGPILVTGATGGVGQFATYFFTKMGFDVHALTGKREMIERLKKLGAKEVLLTSQWDLGERPLENVRFGGAVDNVGGKILAQILAHTQLWGNVACIGLAQSGELHTTVMPFILRGASLLGISSNNTPRDLREKIWQRLSTDLKPNDLESFVSQSISLDEIVSTATKMLNRETYGRTLVELAP